MSFAPLVCKTTCLWKKTARRLAESSKRPVARDFLLHPVSCAGQTRIITTRPAGRRRLRRPFSVLLGLFCSKSKFMRIHGLILIQNTLKNFEEFKHVRPFSTQKNDPTYM